ncbi:hypothetical protein HELRODRAFT_184845 [Helobdella robusta]|uniref:UspA domain-containing protein n=1 Tax=Helobdella robusta TaxID=6412 RepID=T1FM28_HELRO|nr:hypothetical protein HELRODRAFT_184845 [Helobdella robusta]ESO12804.1 hypothetical protein HELRODRAFT_184845 [Helobdella robusta]
MATSPANGRVVVIAVDASDNAMSAFKWYLDEVYKKDDFVVICHIPELQTLPLISFKRVGLPVEEWQKMMEEQIAKINELHDKYDFELISKKIPHKIKSEHNKSPGQGIINVAESEKARLIIIGTRGLDLVRRTVLGSVSDYVVHHSKIPVLVCPKIEN